MTELLQVLLSYPVVVFTALMGLVLAYWLMVIVGTIDLDSGADAGVDAAAKGALDAAAKGALDAAAKGALDAAVDAGAPDADADVDAPHGGIVAALFAFLRVGKVPATIPFTFITFFGWVFSYFAMTYLTPLIALSLPGWLVSTAVLVLSFLVSVPLAGVCVRPLAGIFETKTAMTNRDLVGTVCRIDTGEVGERSGYARVESGGNDLVVPVRVDAITLKRGDRAIIVDYDAEREIYLVEGYDALLDETKEGADRRAGR